MLKNKYNVEINKSVSLNNVEIRTLYCFCKPTQTACSPNKITVFKKNPNDSLVEPKEFKDSCKHNNCLIEITGGGIRAVINCNSLTTIELISSPTDKDTLKDIFQNCNTISTFLDGKKKLTIDNDAHKGIEFKFNELGSLVGYEYVDLIPF